MKLVGMSVVLISDTLEQTSSLFYTVLYLFLCSKQYQLKMSLCARVLIHSM